MRDTFKIINTLLLSGLTLLILGIFFFPIDVLKDNSWRVVIDGGGTHYTDETITVSSLYTKVRKADGKAVRYLDCKTSSGAFLRYELNKADANRKPNPITQGTAFTFGIPKTVAPVPTICKVAIDIDYPIFTVGSWVIRGVSEYQESAEFELKAR